MKVSCCPQLYRVANDNSKNCRVNIPAQLDVIANGLSLLIAEPQRELAVPKTVSFEKYDVCSVLEMLNASDKLSSRLPAQRVTHVVHRLAYTFEHTFSGIDADNATLRLLLDDAVHSDELSVSAPRNADTPILSVPQSSFINVLWHGGIPQSLCSSALKLSFSLAPADRDMIGHFDVLW